MAEERPGLKRAVAALGYRDFRFFYLALLVSAVGSSLQGIANMWQIYELTGSALQLGLTGLARAIPTIALSLAGGVLADRVDRRQVIMWTQAISGGLALLLGILSATGLVQVWHIYTTTFISASVSALGAPARSAIIPNLVPRQHLLNAYAMNSTVWQASRIVGPSLAGICIATLGLPATYAANGLLSLVTLVALATIYLGEMPARPQGSPLKNLTEGLQFVRRRSIILALLGTDTAAMLFGSYSVVLPILADQLGVGAAGYGILSSAPGVGSLVGAGFVMGLGNIRYKGYMIVGAILTYCGLLAALAVSPWFLLSVLIVGALGLSDSLQATPRNAVIQLVTPDALRGRVSAFNNMLTAGMPALGLATVGSMAAALGAPLALIVGAATCAAINLAILAARADLRARDLGSEPQPEVDEAVPASPSVRPASPAAR